MRSTLLAAIIGGLFLSCASRPFEPSKARPAIGCYISCPEGYVFRRQHVCRSDRRHFLDVVITGERITRDADGTIETDFFITSSGDYPRIDVEPMSCSSYISQLIAQRQPAERGQYPGEDDHGRPAIPPN